MSGTDVAAANRILHASRVVPDLLDDKLQNDIKVANAGEAIIQLVVLYVLQACSTLVGLLDSNNLPTKHITIRPKMPCRVLTNNEDVFSFGTVPLTQFNPAKFLPNGEHTEIIHVIHPIGSGEYGDCCLGVSKGGASCCAVKFFHKMKGLTAKQQAENELSNWNKVYGGRSEIPKCFMWKIAGQEACLVMPYLRPIPISDRRRLLDEGVILQTLKYFSDSGYIHKDIKWRHFGWCKDSKGIGNLILFDLGCIKQSTEEAINDWLNTSIASLESKAGPAQESTCTPNRNQAQLGKKRKKKD